MSRTTSSSRRRCDGAATRWRSGRTWSTTTASLRGYASVRPYVSKLRGAGTREAHPVIVTAPGEEGQVDSGDGPMVRQSETGKYRRTRLFVMPLGHSQKAVRLLTFVLDNLKEGVLEPDVYDPELNPLFRDMLRHYDVDLG